MVITNLVVGARLGVQSRHALHLGSTRGVFLEEQQHGNGTGSRRQHGSYHGCRHQQLVIAGTLRRHSAPVAPLEVGGGRC